MLLSLIAIYNQSPTVTSNANFIYMTGMTFAPLGELLSPVRLLACRKMISLKMLSSFKAD